MQPITSEGLVAVAALVALSAPGSIHDPEPAAAADAVAAEDALDAICSAASRELLQCSSKMNASCRGSFVAEVVSEIVSVSAPGASEGDVADVNALIESVCGNTAGRRVEFSDASADGSVGELPWHTVCLARFRDSVPVDWATWADAFESGCLCIGAASDGSSLIHLPSYALRQCWLGSPADHALRKVFSGALAASCAVGSEPRRPLENALNGDSTLLKLEGLCRSLATLSPVTVVCFDAADDADWDEEEDAIADDRDTAEEWLMRDIDMFASGTVAALREAQRLSPRTSSDELRRAEHALAFALRGLSDRAGEAHCAMAALGEAFGAPEANVIASTAGLEFPTVMRAVLSSAFSVGSLVGSLLDTAQTVSTPAFRTAVQWFSAILPEASDTQHGDQFFDSLLELCRSVQQFRLRDSDSAARLLPVEDGQAAHGFRLGVRRGEVPALAIALGACEDEQEEQLALLIAGCVMVHGLSQCPLQWIPGLTADHAKRALLLAPISFLAQGLGCAGTDGIASELADRAARIVGGGE